MKNTTPEELKNALSELSKINERRDEDISEVIQAPTGTDGERSERQECLNGLYEDAHFELDYDGQRVIIGTSEVPMFVIPLGLIDRIAKARAEELSLREETVAVLIDMAKKKRITGGLESHHYRNALIGKENQDMKMEEKIRQHVRKMAGDDFTAGTPYDPCDMDEFVRILHDDGFDTEGLDKGGLFTYYFECYEECLAIQDGKGHDED